MTNVINASLKKLAAENWLQTLNRCFEYLRPYFYANDKTYRMSIALTTVLKTMKQKLDIERTNNDNCDNTN